MWKTGYSVHTSVGGGGHNVGWLANRPNWMLLLSHATAETGGVGGQGKRSVMSRDVVHMMRAVQEMMGKKGIMGR